MSAPADRCAACTMPASDRHHQPGYVMHRTPFDIPGHAYMPEPSRCDLCSAPIVDEARHTAAHIRRRGPAPTYS